MIRQINKRKEKKIRKIVKEIYDLKVNGQFFEFGKNKIWIFNGKISKSFLDKILKITKVETIGLYFANLKGNDLRLSQDAAMIFGDKAKNILLLNDKEAKNWLSGKELEIDKKDCLVILKNNSDILGCGKIVNKRLWNYVSKDRRVKTEK